MISLIVSILDRTPLLKYSVDAVMANIANMESPEEIEVNICDSGSRDGLDDFLKTLSNHEFVKRVNKYYLDERKSAYKKEFNCPALIYNILVKVSSADCIIKIDPEFTFITNGFVNKAVKLIREENRPAIVMPLPHHTYHFDYDSVESIRSKYHSYKYETHITRDTAQTRNVYYGCVFSRQAYLDLGGIDVRFMRGIGSEDDHFLDQWRRKYGEQNVVTLLEEEGVHLWHGSWGQGVPQQYYPWVNMNSMLRETLRNTLPNNGNLATLQYPELKLTSWSYGDRVMVNKVVNL